MEQMLFKFYLLDCDMVSILLTIDPYCIEEILKDLDNFRDTFHFFLWIWGYNVF